MVSVRQGWVAGVMFGLGLVLVGSSWAKEPPGADSAPLLGELELELGARDDAAPSPSFELTVRGTSAGSEPRRDVVLEATTSPRVRLRLPAGAYAVTLSGASVPDSVAATARQPRVAEPSTRWLALPAPELVWVEPGRTTRARVAVARPLAASL